MNNTNSLFDSIEYMIAQKNIREAKKSYEILKNLDAQIEQARTLQEIRPLMIYSISANLSIGAFHGMLNSIQNGAQIPSDPIDALIFQLQKMKPVKKPSLI